MPMLRTIFFTGFLFVLAGKDGHPEIKVGYEVKKMACFFLLIFVYSGA